MNYSSSHVKRPASRHSINFILRVGKLRNEQKKEKYYFILLLCHQTII